MGAENTNGEAAPAKLVPGATAAGEFSSEFMAGVFKRKGGTLPTLPEAKTEEEPKSEAGAQAAAGEAQANDGKTPEEIKAAADAAKVNEGKTAEEIKAAADAKAEADAASEEDGSSDDITRETEEVVQAKLKDLPEAQRKIAQSIINERIGKIVFKSKTEIDRLSNRVTELTSEVETTRKQAGAPIIVPGIHPAMLVDSQEQIDAYADKLDASEDTLEGLKDSGIEADEAAGRPGYTAEQVRARLREIRRERERILPQARELLKKRSENAAALKVSFPELYNPTTEEFRAADALRKQFPELRRLPDADSFVAKFVLGAKVMADRSKTPTGKKPVQAAPDGKAKQPQSVIRKAPRAPGDGSAALGSVLDDASRRAPDASGAVTTFTKTRSREDLKKAVGALVFR